MKTTPTGHRILMTTSRVQGHRIDTIWAVDMPRGIEAAIAVEMHRRTDTSGPVEMPHGIEHPSAGSPRVAPRTES